MDTTFQRIWEAALPYQDKRDDDGHARIVTEYATMLCEIEEADKNIVIPAAILHDVGWSQLSHDDRFEFFSADKTPEDKKKVRIIHQDEGVRIARNILIDLSYPETYIPAILEIISQHDTRSGFISREDGAVRDADKLWRFTKTGLEAASRRKKQPIESFFDGLEKNIGKDGFFCFESAKRIAEQELDKRKNDG